MKEKLNTIKEKVKGFWEEHKKPIKVGLTCFGIGALWGFAKGVLAESKILGSAYDRLPHEPDPDDDEYGLTEESCDDPDLLEIVNSETENA